jgi:hypothetical protein
MNDGTNGGRQHALDHIASLARAHGLTPDDIAAHMLRDTSAPSVQAGMLVRLLSYVGGILVFAGIGYFISLQWNALDSFGRVLITLGPGLAALVLAVATLRDPRYTRAATPLFLIAAFLQPTGLFVMLREYAGGDDTAMASIVVFGTMTAQTATLFWKLRRTSLAFIAIVFGFALLWAMMEKTDIDGDIIATVLGFSGLLVSTAVNRTPHRAFVPFSYFVFAATMAGGIFALLEDSAYDMLLLLVAPLMIFASVRAESRSFLCAAVITMLGYLCYLTERYFADMLGWPIALIFIGLAMIGISAYAVRLGQSIGRSK